MGRNPPGNVPESLMAPGSAPGSLARCRCPSAHPLAHPAHAPLAEPSPAEPPGWGPPCPSPSITPGPRRGLCRQPPWPGGKSAALMSCTSLSLIKRAGRLAKPGTGSCSLGPTSPRWQRSRVSQETRLLTSGGPGGYPEHPSTPEGAEQMCGFPLQGCFPTHG